MRRRRIKWEQAKTGNIGMALVALDREEQARGWVDPSLDKPRKRRLPPRAGHGQDGSWNFCPGLLAGGAYWDELDDVLAEYWACGGGNEFNSPLYSCRVYTAALLSALLGNDHTRSMRFVKRWTAFLALQAVLVRNQRVKEPFVWGGEPATMRHLTRTGLVIPPTGMRVNHSLGETLVAPILAHVLGVPQRFHKRWLGWRKWSPPATKKEAARTGPMPPLGLVAVVEHAEERAGRRLRHDPWMKFCRSAALGNMAKWRELADRVKKEPVALGRGNRRFGIDRDPSAVGTWITGKCATMQKPSVAAAVIAGGRTRVLAPSDFEVPSEIVTSALARRHGVDVVRAEGDVKDSLPRLVKPLETVVFEQEKWW